MKTLLRTTLLRTAALVFLPLLLLASASTPAYAGLSQIGAHFAGQNAALSAQSVGSASSNYLVAVYATQNPVDAGCGVSDLTHTLSWTDEQGNVNTQSIVTSRNGGYASMVIPIKTGTAGATIATTGTFSMGAGTGACVGSTGAYGLYVDGFGFWPTQPQKQAGITETKYDNTVTTNQHVVLATNAPASYLVAVATANTASSVVEWADEYGRQTSGCNAGGADLVCLVPLRSVAGSTSQVFVNVGTAGTGARVDVAAVHFGVPGTGSGPLTDYEAQHTGLTFLGTGFALGTGTGANLFAIADTIASTSGSGNVQQTTEGTSDLSCPVVTGGASTGTGTGLPSFATAVCAPQAAWSYTAFFAHTGSPSTLNYDQYADVIVF